MGAEAVIGVLLKVAGVGVMLLIAAVGWSIRQFLKSNQDALEKLREELGALRALVNAIEKRLVAGDVVLSDIKRRIEKLEAHDENRCKACKLEALKGAPAHTPVPGMG